MIALAPETAPEPRPTLAAAPDFEPGDAIVGNWPGRALHRLRGRVALIADDQVGAVWRWRNGETFFALIPARRVRKLRIAR